MMEQGKKKDGSVGVPKSEKLYLRMTSRLTRENGRPGGPWATVYHAG